MGLLTCKKCNAEKPATSEFFPPHKRTINGFDSWCRECRRSYRKLYRKPPDGIEKQEWKQYDDTIKSCLICGNDSVALVTDHCHTNKFVRGKLCSNCNLGLGHFKDDPELLEFARIYLLYHSQNSEENEEAKEYIKHGLQET